MNAPGTQTGAFPPPGKLLSEGITFALVGWLVAYNVLRLRGDSPADAAWPGLIIGGLGGLVVLGGWLVVRRRLVASGRMSAVREHAEMPASGAMGAGERRTLDLLWPVAAALAVASIIVGAAMGLDWAGTESADRSTAKIIIAGWDVLAGIWILAESWCMRRHDAEGVDAVALGAVLTAVLAGVSLSRDYIPGGQVVLIVLGGLVGAGGYYAVWRLTGRRGLPSSAAIAVVVAALALVLPLTA